MKWEVTPIYEMGSLTPVHYIRQPIPEEEDIMTFQIWGVDDPDSCFIVVALEQYEDFATASPRDALDLLQEMSANSFALPTSWEAVPVLRLCSSMERAVGS